VEHLLKAQTKLLVPSSNAAAVILFASRTLPAGFLSPVSPDESEEKNTTRR
jgi:hypothetical protein